MPNSFKLKMLLYHVLVTVHPLAVSLAYTGLALTVAAPKNIVFTVTFLKKYEFLITLDAHSTWCQ